MKIKTSLLIVFALTGIVACQNPKEKLAEKIAANESLLFVDTLRTLNDSVAFSTYDLYRSYAEQFKDDTASTEYLFKSADLALGIRQPNKALESLDLLIQRYPDSRKASSALFMKAFIQETSLQDKEEAKKIYLQFIEKYPDHPLRGSAQASYDQLQAGLSDEELIRQFESRQDSSIAIEAR